MITIYLLMDAINFVIQSLDGQVFRIQLPGSIRLLLFVKMDFEYKEKIVILGSTQVVNLTVQNHYHVEFVQEDHQLVLIHVLTNANFLLDFLIEMDGLAIKQLLCVKQYVEMDKFQEQKNVMMDQTMGSDATLIVLLLLLDSVVIVNQNHVFVLMFVEMGFELKGSNATMEIFKAMMDAHLIAKLLNRDSLVSRSMTTQKPPLQYQLSQLHSLMTLCVNQVQVEKSLGKFQELHQYYIRYYQEYKLFQWGNLEHLCLSL